MHISIIIPAHNEAAYLQDCLNAFVAQTHPPDELILVDDNSIDNTFAIASQYAQRYSWIKVVQRQSAAEHLPGEKVVAAVTFGLQYSSPYELIGKFDADILLPPCYFERMRHHFQAYKALGMCSGLLYVKKGKTWVYEAIAEPSHIRGPIKLYRRNCFRAIGGLRPGLGWDTVDELLAQYHGFTIFTDPALQVKHLRPTGQGYSTKNYQAKGKALYAMRYGIGLSLLTALKMAWRAKHLPYCFLVFFGYVKASLGRSPQFVTPAEGSFIRAYRWKGIRAKVLTASRCFYPLLSALYSS